jgi:hypothetical protein
LDHRVRYPNPVFSATAAGGKMGHHEQGILFGP